jgi:DNA-binding transcriptional MerR regulator
MEGRGKSRGNLDTFPGAFPQITGMDEIPASAVCKILKIKEDELREWERAGLIVKARSKWGHHDVIQAALVLILDGKRFDHDDIRRVMEGVRESLRAPLPVGRVRLIGHIQGRTGSLAFGDNEAADAAVGRQASTGRMLLVLDVSEEVSFVNNAFGNELHGRQNTPTKDKRRVSELRQPSEKQSG